MNNSNNYKPKLQLLRNLVLVEVTSEDFKKSESGIILGKVTNAVNDRKTQGIVVNTGPDSKIKLQSTVYFEKTSGIDYEECDNEITHKYIILREESILGVLGFLEK